VRTPEVWDDDISETILPGVAGALTRSRSSRATATRVTTPGDHGREVARQVAAEIAGQRPGQVARGTAVWLDLDYAN
jgi:hypothetical protein